MRGRSVWAWGICAVLGAACTARAQPLAASGEGRVLVMPFDGVGRDSHLYWLSEASAVLLGADLGGRGVDVMTRDERVRAFDELQLPGRASLSLATIIRVGELVGAADIIFGTLAPDGDRLLVKVRSIKLDIGRLRPEVVEQGPLTELFATFDRIAGQLAGAEAPAGSPDQSLPPLPAFESYVKGLLAETPATGIKFLQTALAQFPAYDLARIAQWRIYAAEGDHAKALAAIAAVPDRSPEARRARFLAALSRLGLKQFDRAASTLTALAAESPAAAISNNLGVTLLRRGAPGPLGRASRYFVQAAVSDPSDPDYTFNAGYACWLEKDPQEAQRWLRETVRLDPGDGDAHFVLGVALSAGGARVEGERELALARQLSSRYAEMEIRSGGTADPVPSGLERVREDLIRGRHSVVGSTVRPAELREQQELAVFYLDRGRRLFEAEQDREAIVELRRSRYLDPYQAAPHLLLARIYLRGNRAADAIEAAKIALWCEDSAAGHVVLGEAYLLAKDDQMARIEALRGLALDPASAAAKALLGKAAGKPPSGGPPASAAPTRYNGVRWHL
jgi:tetratricopeptide (TPR) repeat protein